MIEFELLFPISVLPLFKIDPTDVRAYTLTVDIEGTYTLTTFRYVWDEDEGTFMQEVEEFDLTERELTE